MPEHPLAPPAASSDRARYTTRVADLIEAMNLQTTLAKEALALVLENVAILDRKQQDYGSANLTKFGTFGVTVRMSDKLERIVNLQKKAMIREAGPSPKVGPIFNEPLGDSFLDLSNYALIAYLMHTEKWPHATTTP